MGYVITLLVGFVAGALCMLVVLLERHKKVREIHAGFAAETARIQEAQAAIVSGKAELQRAESHFVLQRSELERRIISYDELQKESVIMKRDLQNIDVNLHKCQLDGEVARQRQQELDERAKELGSRYLKENVKWIGNSLNANNFAACKQRLQEVIVRCRGIGFDVPAAEEAKLIRDLK